MNKKCVNHVTNERTNVRFKFTKLHLKNYLSNGEGGQRKREIFYLLAVFTNGCNSQSCQVKALVQELLLCPSCVWQTLKHLDQIALLFHTVRRNWIGSRVAGTQTGAKVVCWVPGDFMC